MKIVKKTSSTVQREGGRLQIPDDDEDQCDSDDDSLNERLRPRKKFP